jgi:rod shape-determining protein MreC
LELVFVTQTQDIKAGDRLVSSGMGQIYPKNYPVAEIVSVFSDPGQDFATIKARPLAQLASTRHVMLVFNSEEAQASVRGAADILEPELPFIEAVDAAIIHSIDASATADQIPQAASDAAVQ